VTKRLPAAVQRGIQESAPGNSRPVSWTDVDAEPGPASLPAEAKTAPGQDRRARQEWRLLAGRAASLAYLLYAASAVSRDSRGAGAACGYAILAAFGLCWLIIPIPVRLGVSQAASRRFWILYGILAGLFLAELPFAHAQAFAMAMFITVTTVGRLGARAAPAAVVLALAALLVPPAVPSWHDSLSSAWNDITPLTIPIAALMTFAIQQALRDSHALAEARTELACLAAENERFRIARDLHDLLGHSLTTITVKAGLAARIGQADHARAIQEMTEVEALARQALTEVRAAVASYRQVTLAGELATGRQLLYAAGITADLPRAVDDVSPACQELFGWVLREGITNIVRHSRARTCCIRLSPSSIEITDDGVGGTAPTGNGLTGLRERVTAAGGSIDAGPLHPAGWRLQVSLSTAGHA
jgi:two-component system, NarL family, sensor histidine kinase DesK